jgi:hypothetical protein
MNDLDDQNLLLATVDYETVVSLSYCYFAETFCVSNHDLSHFQNRYQPLPRSHRRIVFDFL